VVIFLAKIPLGDRLDCLRNYRTSHAPILPEFSSLKASGQHCENMRAVNLQTIIQQAADPNSLLAINCSARESHYSERHYFCNIFFRFVSNEIQLQILSIDRAFKITFYKRKRLLNERIRDHITDIERSISVSEVSRVPSTDARIR
jgi:hypothetical protein